MVNEELSLDLPLMSLMVNEALLQELTLVYEGFYKDLADPEVRYHEDVLTAGLLTLAYAVLKKQEGE